MKLKALCALAAATLGLSLRAATVLDDEPLLPEVQALLLQSKAPDAATLGQDAYVAMHALKAPANANYQSIAARIVQDNYSVYQQLLKAAQAGTSISGIPGEDPRKYYREDEALPVLYTSSDFPCRNLYAHNCVEEILEQRSSIKKISTESSPLMQRYLQLTEMPYYSHYFYPVMESNWPNYGVMVSTSFLRLANATLDLEDDKTEQALKIMDGEITFSRRMLVSEHSLIGQMVAVARLYPQLHHVSALMDRPDWRAHLRKAPVAAWIAPLNADELHGFEATFKTELQFGLFQMYTLREKGTDGNSHPPARQTFRR